METLKDIQEMVATCMQCGTCTGTCPNAAEMDATPRRLWRMVHAGMADAVFETRTFALCSSCYACTLRCPQELPLTEAMAALKRLATAMNAPAMRRSADFYRHFLANLRRNGRVRESSVMFQYFVWSTGPVGALKFTPLGLRLMRRGKLEFPVGGRPDLRLEPLFEKAMTWPEKQTDTAITPDAR